MIMLLNYLERKANFPDDPQQTLRRHTEAFPVGKKGEQTFGV